MAIDKKSLPVHIGIIMDGNGRWAKRQNYLEQMVTRLAWILQNLL